jgi:hypothetical protein
MDQSEIAYASPRSSIECIQIDFWVLWYIRRKLCTYLASSLAPSPNGPKQPALEPPSLGVPSGSSKMIFSLWYVCCKPCTYLALTLIQSLNGPKQDSTWHMSPRSTIRCSQNDFQTLWYIQHKPWTYLVSRLALPPNGPKQASNWASSPKSTIGSIQNDSEPMVRLAQTMHQPCTDTNIVSKRTKARYLMTHIT